MSEELQVIVAGARRRIVAALTAAQVARTQAYLACTVGGRANFERFLFAASGPYWSVDNSGQDVALVSGPALFDLSRLVCLLELELCGVNSAWVLSALPDPPMGGADPNEYEIPFSVHRAISRQVIECVRSVDPRITIVRNPEVSFGYGPVILPG